MSACCLLPQQVSNDFRADKGMKKLTFPFGPEAIMTPQPEEPFLLSPSETETGMAAMQLVLMCSFWALNGSGGG